MTAQNFQAALARELVFEGGAVDHPKDPGGRTNRGVTQHVYDGYRTRKGLPCRDVFGIADAEVAEIYRRQYWNAVRGDDLPEGVDFVVFDGAVNSGPSQSVKWLQRALGNVRVDGTLGDATLAAARAHPDHDRLVADVLARRMAFLRALKTWRTFGRGWTSRVQQVQVIGQSMATGSVGPAPVYASGMHVRALYSDAKAAPSPAVADAVTGGGIAATVLDQTVNALTPLANAMPSVGTVVGVLTAVGGLATAAGLAYRWYATRRTAQLADALDTRPVAFLAPVAPQPVNDNPEPEDAQPVPAPVPSADVQQTAYNAAAVQQAIALTPGTLVELPAGTRIEPATFEQAAAVPVVAIHERPLTDAEIEDAVTAPAAPAETHVTFHSVDGALVLVPHDPAAPAQKDAA